MQGKSYANIQWTIDDAMVNCEQLGIEVTRSEAAEILAAKERRIKDVMVDAGWQVIEDALRRNLGDKGNC